MIAGTGTIADGRRIEFFDGKRRTPNGTKKTGYIYWQYAGTDPDTGKRKRTYGGRWDTCPSEIRKRQYQARRGLVVAASGLARFAEIGSESGYDVA